jgi:hypothetical protein
MHPLYGQTVAVRNVRRVGDFVEIMVAHPDGGALTLPGWATDLTPPRPPRQVRAPLPLCDPTPLVKLLHHVASLAAPASLQTHTLLDSIAPPAASLHHGLRLSPVRQDQHAPAPLLALRQAAPAP